MTTPAQNTDLPFDEETQSPEVTPAVTTDFVHMNIYQKINWVSSQIGPLKKTRSVKRQDGSEDYASTTFNQILSLVNPLMEQVGLTLVPIGSKVTRANKMTDGHYTYKLVHTDRPSEVEIVAADAQGFDTLDKGANKASTAGMKYLYMRLFRLETEEDPDLVSNDVLLNQGYPQHAQEPQQAQNMYTQAPPQDTIYVQPQQQEQPQQAPQQQPVQQQPQQPIQGIDPNLNDAMQAHQQQLQAFNALLEKGVSFNYNRSHLIDYLSNNIGVNFHMPETVSPDMLARANETMSRMYDVQSQAGTL